MFSVEEGEEEMGDDDDDDDGDEGIMNSEWVVMECASKDCFCTRRHFWQRPTPATWRLDEPIITQLRFYSLRTVTCLLGDAQLVRQSNAHSRSLETPTHDSR